MTLPLILPLPAVIPIGSKYGFFCHTATILVDGVDSQNEAEYIPIKVVTNTTQDNALHAHSTYCGSFRMVRPPGAAMFTAYYMANRPIKLPSSPELTAELVNKVTLTGLGTVITRHESDETDEPTLTCTVRHSDWDCESRETVTFDVTYVTIKRGLLKNCFWLFQVGRELLLTGAIVDWDSKKNTFIVQTISISASSGDRGMNTPVEIEQIARKRRLIQLASTQSIKVIQLDHQGNQLYQGSQRDQSTQRNESTQRDQVTHLDQGAKIEESKTQEDREEGPQLIRLDAVEVFANSQLDVVKVKVKEFVYGDVADIVGRGSIDEMVDYYKSRTIITPLDARVLGLNHAILSEIPGEEMESQSIDVLLDPDNSEAVGDEVLNTFTPCRFPPHILTLKVGVVLILLRNLNPPGALFKGTRLLLKAMKTQVLLCIILNGSQAGEEVLVPKIILQEESAPEFLAFSRYQFPVVVAFSLTLDKSQDQSYDRVGIFLPHPVFVDNDDGKLDVERNFPIQPQVRSRETLCCIVKSNQRSIM